MEMDFEKILKDLRKLKESILSASDFKTIEGRKFISRSGWIKIKTYFKISTTILSSERIEVERDGQKYVLWRYKVRAQTPDGRFTEAEGICTSDEKIVKGKPEYVQSFLAQTRALNRAISDLVGLGEMSAEEVESEEIAQFVKPKEYERPSYEEYEKAVQSEREIEREMEEYGYAMEEPTSEEETFEESFAERGARIEKTTSHQIPPEYLNMSKDEMLAKMKQLFNQLELSTPQQRREYVRRIIGKDVRSSQDLTQMDLAKILVQLEKDLQSKKGIH